MPCLLTKTQLTERNQRRARRREREREKEREREREDLATSWGDVLTSKIREQMPSPHRYI
jgi:hypothetical protein